MDDGPETQIECPVSPDVLADLYRAGPERVVEILRGLSENRRARLALCCFRRAHLRDVALAIATTCDPLRLFQLAGNNGEALAAQSRKPRDPDDAPRGRHLAKVTLGRLTI